MWLSGIRIIDFTNLLPGPYATMRLADLGCEVVKVEAPNGGDPARYTGPKVAGSGVVFTANNRNKESIVIDLKTDSGRTLILELVQKADVLIEGFRPGVMQKLGLNYSAISRYNDTIVYCSLTGYGQTGPLAHFAGHDLNYMSVSGMLAQICDATGRPIIPSVQFADLIGGIVASEAILAALVKRERTGKGAYIDVSMTDTLIGMLHGHALLHQIYGEENGIPELNGTRLCYYLYQTKDERFVSLAALEPKFWHHFCEAVSKPEWVGFGLHVALDGDPIFEAVKSLFLSRTLAEWLEFTKTTDCCMQPVLNISEVLNSPYVLARNLLHETPEAGLSQIDTHAGGHQKDRPAPGLPPTPRNEL